MRTSHRFSRFLRFVFPITLGCVISCSRHQTPVLRVAINAGDEGHAVAALSKQYSNATVEIIELPYSNLREKFSIALRTNSPYDVVMLDDPSFPELSDELAALEPLRSELEADFVPISLSLGKDPKGQIKALPFVGNCQLLFYRKDLLPNAADIPTTWDQLFNIASQISNSSVGKYGYCIRGKAGAPLVSDFLPILWSLGGDLFASGQNPSPDTLTLDTDKMREALTAYKRLASLSPPAALSYDWTEMTAAFSKGLVAFELNWPAAITQLDQSISRNNSGQRVWGVTVPPGLKKVGTSMAGNWLLAVPRTSGNRDAAKSFITWLLDRELQAAQMGNPPTRQSVFREVIARNDDKFFFYPTLLPALTSSTPRPRTPRWTGIEDVLGKEISAYLSGQKRIDDAVRSMQQQAKAAMR